MNENSYYAKLVEGSNGNYLFEGDGIKYTFKFDPNSEDSWTLSSDDGPIAAEISDTQHYGEEGVTNKGFILELDPEGKIHFEITNPDKVNVGMLKGVADVDPMSNFVFATA